MPDIAEKVIKFRDSIDASIAENQASLKDIVESALQISNTSITNLYTLRFHVEQSSMEDRDEALKFLNLLLDCYDGRSVSIASLKNLQDLYEGGDSIYANQNLLDLLMYNGGISVALLDEAWFEDGKLHQKTANAIKDKDGSFSGKVKSYEELKNFLQIVSTRYVGFISSKRIADLKNKIETIANEEFGDNTIVCFGRINGDRIAFTIFGEQFIDILDGESYINSFEQEYKGVLYEIWVL